MMKDKVMSVDASTSTQSKSLTIMVVDDYNDNSQIVRKGLERVGHDVHAFIEPLLAIQHIQNGGREKCSLLISDIRMPKMNGFQLVRRVKELRPDMRIIMLTAFEVNMKEFNTVFPSTRVDKIIRKPFNISSLTEMVRTIQLKA
jgi:response regulator RpfG family c-di-GMP phosphodiesterase